MLSKALQEVRCEKICFFSYSRMSWFKDLSIWVCNSYSGVYLVVLFCNGLQEGMVIIMFC